MRAVIQRVSSASVKINDLQTESIGQGFVVLLGIEDTDRTEDIEWLARKIVALRVFGDDEGKMNLSIDDIKGEVLLVSQFTLHASTKKGNRPSFIKAAKPDTAIPMYNEFIGAINSLLPAPVKTGEFGAYMQIALVNDGPVTILIDTKRKE